MIDQLTGQFLHPRKALHIDLATNQPLVLEDHSPEIRDSLGGDLIGIAAAGQALRTVPLPLHLHSQRHLRDLLEERLLQQLVPLADGLDLVGHPGTELALLLLEGVDGVPGQLLALLGLLGHLLDGLQDLGIALGVVEVVLGVRREHVVLIVLVLLVTGDFLDLGLGLGGRHFLLLAASAHLI